MGGVGNEPLEFAPPSDALIAIERQRNDDVRKINLEQGDDGETPRIVDHFAYPEHANADFDQAGEMMRQLGFTVRVTEDGTGLICSKETAIAGEKFDRLTAMIDVMMDDLGWQYDGWETPIVRNED